MAGKPCAQSMQQLIINKENCGCEINTKGRFGRVARNATGPFYYDCSKVTNLTNNLAECQTVFYMKNNSNNNATQAMRCSYTAQTKLGQRNAIIIQPPQYCVNNINWYDIPQNIFEAEQTALNASFRLNCILPAPLILANN